MAPRFSRTFSPLPSLSFFFLLLLPLSRPFCSSSVCFSLSLSLSSSLYSCTFLVQRSPCKTFPALARITSGPSRFHGVFVRLEGCLVLKRSRTENASGERSDIYTRGVWRTLLRGLPLLSVGLPRDLVPRGFPLLRFPFPSPSHAHGVSPFLKRFPSKTQFECLPTLRDSLVLPAFRGICILEFWVFHVRGKVSFNVREPCYRRFEDFLALIAQK